MIKNIIFDVGEVLFGYRWLEMLMDYGMTREEATEAGNTMFDDELWNVLDRGTMEMQQVIMEYKQKYPKYRDAIQYFLTHGELMKVPRPEVWRQVHALKEKGYKIYLLSNYSEYLFQAHTRDATFLKDLDGAVVSYEVHMLKPEEGIYRYLLEKYNLKPEESVFLDDRQENIEGAERVGIKGIRIISEQQLLEEMKQLLG